MVMPEELIMKSVEMSVEGYGKLPGSPILVESSEGLS